METKLLDILLPNGIENLQLPDPSLALYYQNLENRIIWLDNEVDETCLDMIRNILRWNQEDKGKSVEDRIPIRIFFFSPGGDLEVNNALIDTIALSETPVWGINVGGEVITFPVAFKSRPYISATHWGGSLAHGIPKGVTTTGFTMTVYDAGGHLNYDSWADADWIAIGYWK